MTQSASYSDLCKQEGKCVVFDNELFEKWLNTRSEQIVLKLDSGGVTSEEMIILVLKAQSNHFEHLDKDLREDMRDLRVDMDKRFEQVDKRFEHLYSILKWQMGLFVMLFSGIYVKLFFG